MKFRLPTNEEINEYVSNHPLVVNLISWSKNHSLPGFHKIPFYDITTFIVNEFKRQDLTLRANSMAFSFFLSLFPSIIALFTLIAYFPIFENFDEVLYTQIRQIMPNKAGEDLFQRIESIATNQRGGLLSISFILAIFFSSNGMNAMMRGFEKSYLRTFKKRPTLQRRLIAIQLTFILGGLLIASVGLIVLGGYLLNLLFEYIKADLLTTIAFYLLRWIAVMLLLYSGISAIYRYGVATRKKIKWFSPGATLAAVLSLIASLLFTFYVDNFGRFNDLYGPIGAIIVLMLWLQLNSMSLLVGFELNASIAVNRDLKEKPEEKEETSETD